MAPDRSAGQITAMVLMVAATLLWLLAAGGLAVVSLAPLPEQARQHAKKTGRPESEQTFLMGGVVGTVGGSLCCTGIPYVLTMAGLTALYYATKPNSSES